MILALAPMEGVVDPVIRNLYTKIGGYQLCITEFVRVTDKLLPAKVFYKYCPELLTGGKTKYGIPCFVQLLGSDPEALLDNALKAVELGAIGIDLNFGCPAKTVNRHDGGSKLLEKPERLFPIINKLRSNIPTNIPVSAKVRLGYQDKSQCIDIAQACDSAGASWMIVHARTKMEAYKPPAHWEYIAMMKDAVQLPVWANGDIWSVEDFKKCKEVSTCEDFVLGRSAFALPDLALQIYKDNPSSQLSAVQKKFPFLNRANADKHINFDWNKILELFNEFTLNCIEYQNGDYALKRSKQWMKFLARNYNNANAYFEDIKRFKTIEELLKYQNINI